MWCPSWLFPWSPFVIYAASWPGHSKSWYIWSFLYRWLSFTYAIKTQRSDSERSNNLVTCLSDIKSPKFHNFLIFNDYKSEVILFSLTNSVFFVTANLSDRTNNTKLTVYLLAVIIAMHFTQVSTRAPSTVSSWYKLLLPSFTGTKRHDHITPELASLV